MFENWDWTGTQDWLEGLAGAVATGTGIFDDVTNAGSNPDPQPVLPTPVPYNPNITLGDFTFSPNWYLIAFGAGLLILAAVLKK